MAYFASSGAKTLTRSINQSINRSGIGGLYLAGAAACGGGRGCDGHLTSDDDIDVAGDRASALKRRTQCPHRGRVAATDQRHAVQSDQTVVLTQPTILHATNVQRRINTQSAVAPLPALGPWATPPPRSRTGPLARKYLPGYPYSWSLRR